MNATQRAAVLGGLELHDEMHSVIDQRTLEIVERRRRTATFRRRGWLVRRLLVAADVLGLTIALLVTELTFRRITSHNAVGTNAEILIFVASLPAWVVVSKLYGLYDHDEERADHSTADDFTSVFHMVTVCTWLFWATCYLTKWARPDAPKLVPFWASAIILVSLLRGGARAVGRRHISYFQNSIIVGAGDVGQLVAKKLLHHPEYGINLVGFIDAEPKERRADLGHLTVLGGIERLPAIIRLLDVERVIVAFSRESHEHMLELIRSLKDLDVQIDIVPRFFELVGPGIGIHTVEGLPLVGLPPLRLARSSKILKRLMDIVVATLGVVALSPLMLLISVLVKLDSTGPVFFRQVRMGSGNRTFRIWKFRTMTADADARKEEVAHLNEHLAPGGDPRMFKIPDDPRVTGIGRWLRRYSLDELPQLFNVLAGEMSLVGPRPLILAEDQYVAEWGRQRLSLKPGITGPWQVLGRNGIPFAEMVALDYLYVTSWSLFGDLKLLFRTVPIIFSPQAY